MVGFGILIPVFPLLIDERSPFRVTPDGWSFTQGLIMLGWLQAIFPFCTFIAAPILGQLSDRHGRRPVLAWSIFGTGVGYMIFAIGISTANIPLLFVGRAIDGLTGGNFAVAQAAVGDISNEQNRAKNFGLVGASFGLGFVIGPYLGGKLSEADVSFYGLFDTPSWFGATTPFWFAAILSIANCIAVLTTFPETLKQKVHEGRLHAAKSITNVVEGFSSDRLRTVLISMFLFNGGFTFFTSFFGVYLRNNFEFNASKTGDYFALVGLFIAFAQAVLVGRVAQKIVDFKVLRFSFFGNALMMMVFFIIPTDKEFLLYLSIPLFTAFNGLTMANLSTLVSRSAEPGKQGEAMGISTSVSSLAQVPASILLGYITTGITSNQPLVVATICIAAAGIFFITFFRPKYVSDVVGQQISAPSH